VIKWALVAIRSLALACSADRRAGLKTTIVDRPSADNGVEAAIMSLHLSPGLREIDDCGDHESCVASLALMEAWL
jgi:hypothetical protein